MKPTILIILNLVFYINIYAQLYFPPTNTNNWETIDPASLGWCQSKVDSLYRFLEANETKAFIILKDGKIVIEKYFNGHSATSNWYWASAGKSLTATIVGIAQQENFLKLSDPTSKYLGNGWTSCTASQEDKITIRNQLSMTTGLDDETGDPYCTLATCLKYKADAGTRWAYHNGPYTLLDGVIENATGKTLNQYHNQKIKSTTGMDGLFIYQDNNNVYFSTARSMARFGLLILNKGNWNGTPVLADQQYYRDMVNTSQSINESYGYLWWLNGKNNYMVPGVQLKIPGSFQPNAPDDMFSALGKNGQFINVVPSQNIVLIRMGQNPDSALVPFLYNDDIWKYVNDLQCVSSSVELINDSATFKIYPNPASNYLEISSIDGLNLITKSNIKDQLGRTISINEHNGNNFQIDTEHLVSGIYFLILYTKNKTYTYKFIKN
jgi:CubicO group peptidase (beta-lactamase class C family)